MKIKFYLAASLASIATATVVAPPVMAQQITSGIEGAVNDESGAPVSGATVVVTDTRTGVARTFTTGANGTFVANSLVTGGPYSVSATAPGYEGQTINDIITSLQGNTSLTFTLSSGGGVIVVTGARVQLAEMAVGPGTSFAGQLLESAPSFNRDIRDVIRLDPRVSLDREDASTGGNGSDRISCLGGNDRGNAFTVDGVPQSDVYGLNDAPFASRSSSPIPYDAIREIQVQFAPMDVEYGQFTGCAINAVTESGGNSFRGGAFAEYSSNSLRSNRVDGLPVPPVEADKRWGAFLGGPIIEDRIFFFGAYEHQEAGQSVDDGPAGAGYANSIAAIPVAAFNEISQVLKDVYKIDTGGLAFSRPFYNNRYFARLDFVITEDHRLETTYQRVDESTVLTDDFSTTATNARITGLNTYRNSGSKSNYYSGRLYSQWSDILSTDLRFAHSQVVDNQGPVGGGEAQDENPIPRIIVGIDNGNDGIGPFGSVLAGPGFSRSANDLRYNLDQARFVANIDAGSHRLKFGAEISDLYLENLFIQNATGTLYFRNVNDLREGIIVPGGTSTNPSTTELVNGQSVGAHGSYSSTGDPEDATAILKRQIYSLFAQDEWELSDTLSATLGLRVDIYDGNAPTENPLYERRYGFANTTGFSDLAPVWQPRFALTWEPDDFAGFSRPVFRGGVGVFGGGDPGVWFGNAYQNNGITFAEGTYRSSLCPAGNLDVVVNGQFTGVPTCFKQDGVTSAARGEGDAQAISPDIVAPTVVRANFGFEADLDWADAGFFSGWHLNADYIWSRYRNPLGLVDLSQTPDIRIGLNGFAIDGRPVYRSLDPLRAGCGVTLTGIRPVPTFSGLTTANAAACFGTSRDDELLLVNDDGYTSQIVSGVLSKNFDRGIFTENGSIFMSLGMAYTHSRDRRNQYSSTAGSVYDGNAVFDRQNPAATRGFYNSKYNISVQTTFREEFIDDLATTLGVTFVARSGRPYSLTFTGRYFNDINTTSFDTALIYLPTGITDPNIAPTSNMAAVQSLVNFANNLPCAARYIGQSVPRNSCSQPWYKDMDLSFSQEIPGPGSLFNIADDKIRLYATIDNFLNLLDGEWNIQRRRNFLGATDLAEISGIDAQGRYIFTNATAITPNAATGLSNYDTDEFINVTGSAWRLKVGLSYQF